jgi:hypothetical protein
MDKAWVTIIAALCGAVVGGLLGQFTSWFVFRHQRDWERDKLIQQKLEEIYVLTTEARRLMVKISDEANDAAKGLTKYSGEAEEHLLTAKLLRLEALVLFYAPKRLKSYADKLRNMYNQANLKQSAEGDPNAIRKKFSALFSPESINAIRGLKDETLELARQRLRIDEAWKKSDSE